MRYRVTLIAAMALVSVSVFAQNVGIGTTTPGTKLTVAGGIASMPVSAAAAASVTIPNNASIFYLTAVAGSRTDALTMASPTAGQYLTIYNLDGNPATFAGYTITASTGVMTFQYINGTWQAVSDNSFIGGGNYVKNQTGQQASSNFNISGNGVIGGNATVQSLNTAGVVTNTAAGLLGTTPIVTTANGGTGVSNAGTISNASNTIITGGGTLGLGGYTLTVPATGTAAEGTGTINYPSYWSGANTLTSEQYLATVRGGMGANMTAGAIGAIPYSTSTTTYGTLADVAAGAILVSGGVGAAPSWISSTGTGVQGYWTRSGTTLYNTNTGDNVGIGTSSPVARLHVITTGNQSGGSLAAWSGLEAVIGPGSASGTQPALGFAYDVANTVGTIYSLAPNVAWENLALRASTVAMYGSGSSLGLYVNTSGYVGAGTTSPMGNVDIEATTANTFGHLVVNRNNAGAVGGEVSINNLAGGTGASAVLGFGTDNSTDFDGSGNNQNNAEIRAVNTNGGSANATDLRFSNWSGSAENVNMAITSNGYVGVGTISPINRLTVIGDGSGTANIGGGFCGSNYTGISFNGQTGNCSAYNILSSPTDENLYINRPSGYSINFRANNGDQVTIGTNGYLGVGTTTPSAPLYVAYANNSFNQGSYTYYANGSGTGNNGSFCTCNFNGNCNQASCGGCNVAIYAAGRIEGSEFDANSDQRIKKDFHRSDPADDIETLSRLKVTDFRYKDEVANGPNFKKGFIAQEVQAIYPQAVSTHTDFITDVFAMPESCTLYNSTLTVRMKAVHGFCDGDMVRLITPTGKEEVKVNVQDDYTFIVNNWPESTDQVFVYGKQADDFLAVDYDRIYTLNVSATQTLIRQLHEEQIKNQELEQELADVKKQGKTSQSDIDRLKASVETLQQIIGRKAEK